MKTENKLKRMKELTDLLNMYRNAYYNDSQSLISDHEYDLLFDELEKLEKETGIIMANSPTQTVGYEAMSELEKVTHSHPMLSLGKTKSVNDLVDFSAKNDSILSLKMDGLTVLLTYENGKLIQAETRGNGETGEIITHNARTFENIPVSIDYKGHLEIEGEAIITYHDYKKINDQLPTGVEKYKTPRNLASGSVRLLNSEVAAKRHIRFITWKVPAVQNETQELNTFSSRFEFAERLGFEIVPYIYIAEGTTSMESHIETLKKNAEEKGYPIDGLVIAYNDIAYGASLGMTGHHPKHSMAFKFYDEEVETTITDVEFSMGKTGALTPVAVFETVEIDGTDVSRASLHNISILKDLQIGIGDTVTVYKANQIIPQISDNLTRKGMITVPDVCPVCGHRTEIVKDKDTEVLMCMNSSCKGKLLGKLSHAVSKNALNIDGLSEATIEKFIELSWLSSIKDVYHLKEHEAEMKMLEGFGEKSATKLLAAIEESRNISLDRFLYSLSIPLIGRTASKDISKTCHTDIQIFEEILNSGKSFTEIDGFGDEMEKALATWWNDNREEFDDLKSEFNMQMQAKITDVGSTNLDGKVFVITGSLVHYKNRDELVSAIEEKGGKVSGSVSAKTSYLINNDTESSSSKNKKAKQLGVPIISEETFRQML